MRQSVAFVIPVGVFLIILFPYLSYVPMWDSGVYLSHCVLEAVNQPFNLMAYNCYNHGSLVFGLVYALSQYISYGNSLYIHLTSLVLLIIGFYFYYLILKHFFKDQLTVAIGMALLCWNPGLIANAINPTPDLTVMIFSIVCLWAFLNQRVACAALSGLALLFAKEPGAVFYGLSSFLYIVIFLPTAKNRRDFLLKNCLYLGVPLFIYGIFIWYKINYAHADFLFKNTSILLLINHISPVTLFQIPDNVLFSPSQPYSPLQPFSVLSAFYSIFLLNFQWIIFAGILLGLAMLHIRQRQKVKSFLYPFESREIIFVFLLTIILSYILSRFPHFLNMRYYLLFFPLTALLFIYVLHTLKFNQWPVFAGALAILLVFSCFYTIDPVSRLVFGTFNFGNHALLSLTSRTGECCGYGRDQLVYNLQHAELQILLKQFAAQKRLNKNDIIIANFDSDYMVYERLGDHRYARALCLRHDENNSPIIFRNLKTVEVLAAFNQASRIFYPRLPNLRMEEFTQEVLARFKPVEVTRVTHNGYELDIMQLEVKGGKR